MWRGKPGRCWWCGRDVDALTDDHAFPNFLGGTLDLCVPACAPCNNAIGSAEREVARHSLCAVRRVQKGPPGRKKKPESGSAEMGYVLVRDWMQGLHEMAIRAPNQLIALPSLEVRLSPLFVVKRGTVDEYRKLIASIRNALGGGRRTRKRLLQEVPVDELLASLDPHSNDPDFWPRFYLNLRGQLRVRARSRSEARALWDCARLPGFLDLVSSTENFKFVTVEGPTNSTVFSVSRVADLHRVAAKLAAGSALLSGKVPPIVDALSVLRAYVLGDLEFEPDPVELVADFFRDMHVEEQQKWPGEHTVSIEDVGGELRALVVIYDALFAVDMRCATSRSGLSLPIVARCPYAGGVPYFLEPADAEVAASETRALLQLVANPG